MGAFLLRVRCGGERCDCCDFLAIGGERLRSPGERTAQSCGKCNCNAPLLDVAACIFVLVADSKGSVRAGKHSCSRGDRGRTAVSMTVEYVPVTSYLLLITCSMRRYKKSGGTPGDHTILIDTWRVRVASPALYLASNTLPMLTKGWGNGLCFCTIGCWIMAVCGMCLLAVEPPQLLLHRSAVLVCSAALALLPLALSVDPASTTTQCGKLLDSINAIGTSSPSIACAPRELLLSRVNLSAVQSRVALCVARARRYRRCRTCYKTGLQRFAGHAISDKFWPWHRISSSWSRDDWNELPAWFSHYCMRGASLRTARYRGSIQSPLPPQKRALRLICSRFKWT